MYIDRVTHEIKVKNVDPVPFDDGDDKIQEKYLHALQRIKRIFSQNDCRLDVGLATIVPSVRLSCLQTQNLSVLSNINPCYVVVIQRLIQLTYFKRLRKIHCFLL